MRSLRELIDPGGRSLAFHINRLQAKLDDLRQRLREAAARLLGDTVTQVVQEIIERLLEATHTSPPPVYEQPDYRRDMPYWAERDPAEDDYGPQDVYLHEDPEEYRPQREPEESRPQREPEAASVPCVARWRKALAFGLRAAAWWMQRRSGGSSLAVAVGFGATATAVVLAGGPLTLAGASLAASALGLAGIDSLVHAGTATLGVLGVA